MNSGHSTVWFHGAWFIVGLLGLHACGPAVPQQSTPPYNGFLIWPSREVRLGLFSDKEENPDSTSEVTAQIVDQSGPTRLRVTYDIQEGGYGGVIVPVGQKDLTGYGEIVLRVHGEAGGPEAMRLQLVSANNLRKAVSLAPYASHSGSWWTTIRVPLSAFRLAPRPILAKTKHIAIVFGPGHGAIEVDRIRVEGHAVSNELEDLGLVARPLPADHGAVVGRSFDWSGYDWQVRPATGDDVKFPGPNYWSDANESVWVDSQGRLHLSVKYYEGNWYCSEVYTQRSLGYGTYIFRLSGPMEQLDKNMVIGLYTYLDDENEIDIEFTKWGQDRRTLFEQYTVQPHHHPGNVSRQDHVPRSNKTTHLFRWDEDRIVFESYDGHDIDGRSPYRTWTYTGSDIPRAAAERLHMNLWLFRGHWPSDLKACELIVDRFEFVPARDPSQR